MTGCDNFQRNAARTGKDIDNSLDATRYKISRYIYEETPNTVEQDYIPPQRPRFCYDMISDIVCYDRPQPQLHLNLVAAHGEHHYGYEDYLPNSAKQTVASHYNSSPPNYSNPILIPQTANTFAPAEATVPSYSQEKMPMQKSLSSLPPAVKVGSAPSVASQ
jgi:hypothetical protein